MVNIINKLNQPEKLRHPQFRNKPQNPSGKKPPWIKVRYRNSVNYHETHKIIKENNLVTVCQEAACPNVSDCWDKKHATFMILGDTCTRACSFCNVKTGIPEPIDQNEALSVANAVKKMDLRHVVITSVDRDDLEDGGAQHFVNVIANIRKISPSTTIEILTPDFLRKDRAIDILMKQKPDVFNHNLETVPSMYLSIRPGARYFHSLNLLKEIKNRDNSIFTKSGIMVGLGEKREEVLQVMDDMISANVDFITIGQYLQPTIRHAKVMEYVHPEIFESYASIAKSKGFKMVSASPFTRSSFHADEDFIKLKNAT